MLFIGGLGLSLVGDILGFKGIAPKSYFEYYNQGLACPYFYPSGGRAWVFRSTLIPGNKVSARKYDFFKACWSMVNVNTAQDMLVLRRMANLRRVDKGQTPPIRVPEIATRARTVILAAGGLDKLSDSAASVKPLNPPTGALGFVEANLTPSVR